LTGIIVPAPTSKTLQPQAQARMAFGARKRDAAKTRHRERDTLDVFTMQFSF
jgi:hypothetical protein